MVKTDAQSRSSRSSERMDEHTGEWVGVQDLPLLVRSGLLVKSLYVQALFFLRNSKAWNHWAMRALLALGVGHVLAGIVFFFAYNWNDLSQTTKFGLVQGGMIVSAIGWIGLKLDRPIAQAFGICLTILIGVFLAVFGQVFQTPAALYTPFTLWAVMSFPFAAVSRSVAHWAVWLVIAFIAALMYIHYGLVPAYGYTIIAPSYLALGTTLFALLFVYDWVENKGLDWMRASWFRLLLVAGFYGFVNIALVLSLWGGYLLIWILSLFLSTAFLAYLYFLRTDKSANPPLKRVGSLVLAASGISIMAAQIGLRAIVDVMDGSFVIMFLIGFLWMVAVTYILARSFKHFTRKFAGERAQAPRQENNKARAETGDHFDQDTRHPTDSFAAALQIDAQVTVQALQSNDEDITPWYMEMFLGFAGMLTSILAMGFLGGMLAIIFKIDSEISLFILGLVVFGAALFMRLRNDGLFPRHFFNTVLLGGGALAVISAALLYNEELPFIAISVVLSIIPLWLVRDRILEFIMAVGLAALLIYSLLHYNVPYAFSVLFITCTALGLLCLTRPVKSGIGDAQQGRIFAAAGTAFLLAPCAFAFVLQVPDFTGQEHLGMSSGWVERGVSVLVAALAIWGLNARRVKGEAFRPPLVISALLLAAIAMMPLGGAAALLILLTGYILGLRSLAVIGVLAQIAFIIWYYYDLDINLLNKSLLLMGFGAVLLLAYAVAIKKGGRRA